jgi:hypothetical protein
MNIAWWHRFSALTGQRAIDQANQHGHPSSQVTPNGRTLHGYLTMG